MRSTTRVTAAIAAVMALLAVGLATTTLASGAGAQAQEAGPAAGVYLLRNAENGRYLDADFGDFNVETSANPGDDDEWDLIANDDGTWLLRNEVTGRYLDVDRGGSFNVDQSINPAADDRWRIEAAGPTTYYLINNEVNRYLDADGADRNFNVDTSVSPSRDDEWELLAIDVAPPPPPAPPVLPEGPPVRYTIEFTNITEGQWLTPPNFAAHTQSADVFEVGQPANAGVQAVAENGGVPVLAGLLDAVVDQAGLGVSGVGAAEPIPPGATVGFDIETNAPLLSIVSMIICTNDGFAGLDSVALPSLDGDVTGFTLEGYDAGTEVNTEQRSDLVSAPFCGEGSGTEESNPELAENGVITPHPTLTGDGNLNPLLDWNGPVAEVIITRADLTVPSYEVTIENLTSGQYLTPPNWAVHNPIAHVFQVGQPASAGVQAVAENGGVPVLADELAGALSGGLGMSGVGEVDGPIAPGTTQTFTIAGADERLSIVSMIICTNDGFTGLDSRPLPSHGETSSWTVKGYDAGTEVNTEVRADLVGAPFCGAGEGSGESNPNLAEGGVVRPHRTLLGIGDLDPALDWSGPVARITVTRGPNVPIGSPA